MALDALCGRPQRNFKIDGSHGGLRNGLPAIADFGREFETLQCAENGESDPMHIERPPFVSKIQFRFHHLAILKKRRKNLAVR